MSKNKVIGKNGKLPWSLPRDKAWYLNHIQGMPLIMGRKTFEAIDHPHPGRINIIVTRDTNYVAEERAEEENYVFNSIEEAVKFAESLRKDEVMINGGSEIYKLALEKRLVQKMYLTVVDTEIKNGDAFFSEFDEDEWLLESSEKFEADEENEFGMEFRVYKRRE